VNFNPRRFSHTDTHTSDALIARVREGDARALESLIQRHAAGLIRYATQTVGSADRAQEVVQEVFWTLWETRATLQVTQDVRAYLYWLTRRRALDAFRADHAAREREQAWVRARDTEATNNDGVDVVDAAELRARMWSVLQTVPPRCREIFMLVWDDQLPYAEVAKRLGIGLATVKNQMSRALKCLTSVSWRSP